MSSSSLRVTEEQVAAAQLRIVLDEKLNRHTPDIVRRIAAMTGADSTEDSLISTPPSSVKTRVPTPELTPPPPVEDDLPRWSLLRLLQARRARRLRMAHDQRFAQHVQDILATCGLTQATYSIGGGRALYLPEVVSVDAGPPVKVNIRLLPGQTPDDFARHASAIAYSLSVRQVTVTPLGPSHIRLELGDRYLD
jgi:hypothetical protein